MSSVSHIEVSTKAELDAAVAANSSKKATFILFGGAVVPETGASWCPDCIEADPVIEKAFEKFEGDGIVIKVPLVRADYKGNAAHWARYVCDGSYGDANVVRERYSTAEATI